MPPIYADEMQVLGSELPVIDNLADYPTVSLQPTSIKMSRVAWQGSGAKFTQGDRILYHELKLEVFR
ncbi:hypothetical protein [Lacticaseibacillus paracasei]|uniref:hypothetical protein n=1 Tax=Lacticaseibacillus paracasei TaxID=1597 RepID=UPI003AF0405C